jgi:hypothetical protein
MMKDKTIEASTKKDFLLKVFLASDAVFTFFTVFAISLSTNLSNNIIIASYLVFCVFVPALITFIVYLALKKGYLKKPDQD